MKYPWKKLYIRKDCDLPTSSASLETAYDIHWKYTRKQKEYLLSYFYRNNIYYYIHDIGDFDVGRMIYQRYYCRPAHIRRAYAQGITLLRQTTRDTTQWRKHLNKRMDHITLARTFKVFEKSFWEINYDYSIRPWWALEAWQYDFLRLVNELIATRHAESQQDRIWASLLKPWRPTAIEQLQRQFRRGVSVETLVQRYQFLRSWTIIWFKPITAEWIQGVCEQHNDSTDLRPLSMRAMLKILKPSTNQRRYFDAAPFMTFFKDWRDDLRRQHAFRWHFLFETIGTFYDIDPNDLGYLTFDELRLAALNGSIDRGIIASRKNRGCFITTKPPNLAIRVIDIPNDRPTLYHAIVESVDKVTDTSVVKGIIAQTGIAKGPVVVIRHYKDIFKVKEGDVLVANTTHPNYLMGMKKALAFVTDEGGIASHAAIVAREMKKPCVVGTKNATKMLKEGDMVEVNGNDGIVRKLSI